MRTPSLGIEHAQRHRTRTRDSLIDAIDQLTDAGNARAAILVLDFAVIVIVMSGEPCAHLVADTRAVID